MYLNIIIIKILVLFLSCLSVEGKVRPFHGGILKGSPMWHRHSIDPSPNKKFLLSFAIRLANSETAEQALLSVSDLLLPTYGQFWTYSEVTAQFLPTPDAIHSVLIWLYRDIEPHDN